MSATYFVETVAGQLSGRIAGETHRPRGLVLALHGGTYDSNYYDTGAGSLISVAASLGLCVVALDRPGYGAGTSVDPTWCTLAGQSELLSRALRQIIQDVEPAQGTVLVGHSIGGMVALQIAAQGSVDLRGVEVSGIGARWRPGMRELWSSFVSDATTVDVPPEAHASVMFGPADTYDRDQLAVDAELIRPMPMPELVDVVRWTEAFPAVAEKVTAPVSLTFPEHDNIWMTDPESRSIASALFTRAAVRVELLQGAGHCIELHRQARNYCLRQLAFVEECLSHQSMTAVEPEPHEK